MVLTIKQAKAAAAKLRRLKRIKNGTKVVVKDRNKTA